MMFLPRIALPLFASLWAAPCAIGQETKPIRLKKEHALAFFQAGEPRDTISRAAGSHFYLLVPDSMREHLAILVDNGRLVATGNDSLVRLEHLPGIAYESRIQRTDRRRGDLKALINGASDVPRATVRIRLVYRSRLLLENRYLFNEPESRPGRSDRSRER